MGFKELHFTRNGTYGYREVLQKMEPMVNEKSWRRKLRLVSLLPTTQFD